MEDDDVPRHILAELPRPITSGPPAPDYRFLAHAASPPIRVCEICGKPLGKRDVRFDSFACFFAFRP